MKKTLYKTVVVVEVLSEEPIGGKMTLSDVLYECEEGSMSMLTLDKVCDKPIKGVKAVKELDLHGTDYEFFGMDSKGNEINL